MDQSNKNFLSLLANNVDPKLLTINLAEHEQRMTAHYKKMEELNPPKPEPAQKELARLRGELFNLQQRAKHTEVYTNEQAGKVKLLESDLAHTLKQKKIAAEAGNLRGERNYDNTITRLETELADAQREFQRARKVSAGAAIQLSEWPHHTRVEELLKLVG